MIESIFLTAHQWMTRGDLVAGAGCFLWGIISVLFSPCHLASIPLIVAFVAGHERTLEARQAAALSLVFTIGLFITIAAIGVVCSLLGRLLGEASPYWTILLGVLLIWVALDMLNIAGSIMSGGLLAHLKVRGLSGAFILGLAYGVLSGSCTFGFMAPILAVITVQEKLLTGIFLIALFGLGHCLPIAVAGSSTARVKRILDSERFMRGGLWFRRLAGSGIGFMGFYFVARPFLEY